MNKQKEKGLKCIAFYHDFFCLFIFAFWMNIFSIIVSPKMFHTPEYLV